MQQTKTTGTLTNQHLSRQLDLVPTEILGHQINIIGAGAIGSWTCLALAKMGFKNMAVFDHDEVDIVNMSSQFFGYSDIGQKKTKALSDRVYEMTTEVVVPIPERWTPMMKLRGVTIMAVDSMETRKAIFESHINHVPANCLIDARMGAETALLYTISPNREDDIEFYRKSLYSDPEAIQAPCSAKSTTYCALILAGLVTKTVRDILLNKKYLRNMTFSLKENDLLAFSKGEN